jgi:hypothetical protein
MVTVLTPFIMMILLCFVDPAHADEPPLVTLLRAQAFNKIFDGFDYYHVTIESDRAQADGTHEVTAVASGKFLDQTKSIRVLLLIAGGTVVGGQVLEETGLPPCVVSVRQQDESL